MTTIDPKKDVEIVISRYNEDISWVEPYLDRCTIYNKGEDNINYPSIKLPNIGREQHTLFYHIYNNYDNLPNYLIFLQGIPFNHFHKRILKYIDAIIDPKTRSLVKAEDPDLIPFTNWIKTMYLTTENVGECNMFEMYARIFKSEPQFEQFEYAPCGQFCISKKRIKKRSKTFYKNILKIFDDNLVDNNDYAFCLQKFDSLIFS